MSGSKSAGLIQNSWSFLKKFTRARLALGRAGNALPTEALLEFRLAHARARDAVYSRADFTRLRKELASITQSECLLVRSAANGRTEYLKRPDLGRSLSEESIRVLTEARDVANSRSDVILVIADGLSATAINQHAAALVQTVIDEAQKAALSVGEVIIAQDARVALGDEIGEILGAKLVVVLIGERPGLSNVEGIGAYLTFDPKRGRTDAERNCISNICPAGLGVSLAASQIIALATHAIRYQMTGVKLSDGIALNHP